MTWPRPANEMGEPISCVMIAAMSSISAMICAADLGQDLGPLGRRHARPGPVVEGGAGGRHGLVDVALGAVGHPADDLLGDGEITEMGSVPSGATQSPPMNKRS